MLGTFAPLLAIGGLGLALGTCVILAAPMTSVLGMVVARTWLPVNDAVTLALLGCGSLAVVSRFNFRPAPELIWPLGLYLALGLVTLKFTPAPWETPRGTLPSYELIEWVNLGATYSALLLGMWAVRSDVDVLRVVQAVVLASALPVLIGVLQIATGDTVNRDGYESIQGPFAHPSQYAIYLLAVLTFVGVSITRAKSTLYRACLGGLGLLAAVCLYATFSRGPWVGALVILAVLGATRYRAALLVVPVALVLVVLWAPGVTDRAVDRVSDVTSSSSREQSSWGWRVEQWTAVTEAKFTSPWSATGFGTYPRATVEVFGFSGSKFPINPVPGWRLGYNSHNDYVKSLVELGIPGLVLWIAFYYFAIRSAWRWRSLPEIGDVSLACAALFTAFAVMSLSDNIQMFNVSLTLLLLILGAVSRRALDATNETLDRVAESSRNGRTRHA